ncbi:hypothetical protein NADRNF5_0882 [Nitrosopumilus adriaticus]|uniref:Uncharacterized protein n=1 Tax=Nitrosopumilus adriaticus TaxID=1580092 RepID=A0A0D5C1H7_9ARCH|nr:hypothetical protein NADRNF5_0882 [Nitrosopumilus adriaticus]
MSAIWTCKGTSSTFIVPLGNSTDSSLLSLGIDIKPTAPIITAAIKIGIRTWDLVVMSKLIGVYLKTKGVTLWNS